MKKVFRYVFAAGLATTVYFYANNAEANSSRVVQQDQYKITDSSHPDFGQVVDESQLEDECPGDTRECAQNTENPTDIVLWTPSASKF
jgi:cysteinyl-tRNA synthetase